MTEKLRWLSNKVDASKVGSSDSNAGQVFCAAYLFAYCVHIYIPTLSTHHNYDNKLELETIPWRRL